MFKDFIEWTEGDPARGRKVVLFSTVIAFLIITVFLFAYPVIVNTPVVQGIDMLYFALVGLMASIYGFYTGTSSDKSNKVADKAADIMIKKMDEISKSQAKK